MVIDGADNCAYDVFAATDDEFSLLFPGDGQDVAFIDEILGDAQEASVEAALERLWARPVDKKSLVGLHGTMFYQLDHKKQYYPNRKDSDLTASRAR